MTDTLAALQAHSQVRHADIARVFAEYVARRMGAPADSLLPALSRIRP